NWNGIYIHFSTNKYTKYIVETHSSASYAQSKSTDVNTGRRRTAVRLFGKLEWNLYTFFDKQIHKVYRRNAQQCVLCAK
ncbi:hypothetical protein J2Y38_003010, partial [Flavobacterium sp. 2755]|nr:hypothetical protein [Flavobacterium sp. 2755]